MLIQYSQRLARRCTCTLQHLSRHHHDVRDGEQQRQACTQTSLHAGMFCQLGTCSQVERPRLAKGRAGAVQVMRCLEQVVKYCILMVGMF